MAQETSGFVEIRGSYSAGVDGTPVQLVERFRPTFEAPLGSERVMLSTTIEAGLAQGRSTQKELQRTIDESDLGVWLDAFGCEWPSDDNGLFGISQASDYLSVDRLYVDWYHPKFDLRVGRQALNWGSALFVNPTDPYPQVLFTEPWKPRAGVNSARITVPFGELNQFQVVVGTDDLFQKVRAAGRGTIVAGGTDFSLVTAYRQESDELLTGIDIKGTLGVGYWVEASLHLRELFDSEEDLAVAEQLAVGVDYSFPILQSFIVSAQYYRNGAGATSVDDYSSAARATQGVQAPECSGQDTSALFGSGDGGRVDPFAPFFAARSYGLLAMTSSITQDVSFTGAWLQNFDDGSGFIIPTVGVSPYGSLQVSASGQIPVRTWGGGGEFHPRDSDLTMEVPIDPDLDPIEVPLDGLLPDATFILWTRASF